MSPLSFRCLLILALVDLPFTFTAGCGNSGAPAEPTATHTPVSTETPTAMPTAPPAVYQLYDDFSQSALDEKAYEPSSLDPSSGYTLTVQEGALRIERIRADAPGAGRDLTLLRPQLVNGADVKALRARIQVPATGGSGSARINVHYIQGVNSAIPTPVGATLSTYTEMGLTSFSSNGEPLQVYYLYNDKPTGERFYREVAPASFGEWYEVEVALDTERLEWVFKLNGDEVGRYQPQLRQNERLLTIRMWRYLGVWGGEGCSLRSLMTCGR